MAWKLIVKGKSLLDLPKYEKQIQEGQKAKLVVLLKRRLGEKLPYDIERGLKAKGIPGAKAYYDAEGNLAIEYRKSPPWLAVIIAVILALILAILILGWELWVEVVEIVKPEFLIPLAIIGYLAYQEWRRRR